MKLSEYGVFKTGAGEGSARPRRGRAKEIRVAGKTEEEVYRALGLPYIPPEIREDSGEIEAARAGTLPALVELADIRGDLHCHSNYSDGAATLEEIAAAGKKQRLLVHSHHRSLAEPPHRERPLAGAAPQAARRDRSRQREAQGLQAPQGERGRHPPRRLARHATRTFSKRLDVVYVADSFEIQDDPRRDDEARRPRDGESRTRAFSPIRPGASSACATPSRSTCRRSSAPPRAPARRSRSTPIPARLDLDAASCRAAAAAGVMIGIGTDTHVLPELDYMIYGIGTARRGWLTKANILNTRTARELLPSFDARNAPHIAAQLSFQP